MLTIKNNEEVYSAPECMVISVKVQGMLCQSNQFGPTGGVSNPESYSDEDDME